MWNNLKLIGTDKDWVEMAIEGGNIWAVIDGFYTKELFSNLNLAAFIFECLEGRHQIIGSFPEQTPVACAY